MLSVLCTFKAHRPSMASRGFHMLGHCPILHHSMHDHGVCNDESRESEIKCSGLYRDCVPDADGSGVK